MSSQVRTFVAVNLGLAVVRRVADEVRAIRKELAGSEEGLRWVSPESLHVTMKFLGWIPEASVEVVRDTVERLAAPRRPFTLGARGLGTFPGGSHPRVVWVGLADPQEVLAPLAREIEDALADLGFAREERAFRPHLTVARLKESPAAVVERLLAALQARAELELGSSPVSELVVYRSDLKPRGAEYTALARLPLSGAAPVLADDAAHRPPPELEDD